MSSKAQLQKIAQVLKSNGADGELVIGFREVGPEDIDISEPVFIYFDGLPVPFFFESFQRRGQNKALARLTGVGSFEDAEEIVGRSLWVEPEKHGLEMDGADGDALVDWDLEDEQGRMVGKIVRFLDFGGNACLEVRVKDASDTFLVPFHEDLIISIDEEKFVITMRLPAGL